MLKQQLKIKREEVQNKNQSVLYQQLRNFSCVFRFSYVTFYDHYYIIINKLYSVSMTSSYNLRHRQKQLSPSNRKQLCTKIQELQKASPKTEHKILDQKHVQAKMSKKSPSQSNFTVGSTTDLQTNSLLNNELFNAQMNSNSQLDSAVNLRKNKIQEIEIGRQEDNVESVILYDNGLGKQQTFKDLRRYHSEVQMGSDKKQYKNIKHPIPIGVPYRKFQTQMEEKVVSIINKIKQKKVCVKQLEKLFNKILSSSSKDLRNKYFVSGIAVLVKLVSHPQSSTFYEPQLVEKILKTYQNLKQRIANQLDNIENFQIQQPPRERQIDNKKLIRRIFGILRKKERNADRETIQNKSIELGQQFCSRGANIKQLFETFISS